MRQTGRTTNSMPSMNTPFIMLKMDRKFFKMKVQAVVLILLAAVFLPGVQCHDEHHPEMLTARNTLTMVPPARGRIYQRALGKSSIFTCYANVDVPERLTDFRWWWPDGRMIEPTDPRVEIMQDQPGYLTLLFTSLQEEDLGTYKCTANYANTMQLQTDFTVRAYVPITFEDAPINQYAVKGQDYKVKCRVKADPPPQVDWKKDHRMIMNSDHYVMDKDGVVIRGVTEQDEGVYTCRVRVVSMGTIEEKQIQLQVHEFPQMISVPEIVEGVETESVHLQCLATGKPPPEYEWVNHRHQDLSVLERHTVDKYKGTLQIDGVKREDAGQYTCTAENTAGHVSVTSTLQVVSKPVIEELKNVTTNMANSTEIICRASGEPAPDILFHKDSRPYPFELGPDPHDPRIFMDVRKDPSNGISIGTLKITDVQRYDDGLYNCIAYNKRIKTELNGHITVEFPPTFANTPVREVWSWDGRPVNVTCLAEGIPNATISWYLEGALERPIDPYTPNIRQYGFQSTSALEIRPIDRYVYGFYKCIATNKLGVAEHLVQLREARIPGPILEAIVFERTATSLSYRIIGPIEDGGLPVKSFVAQYKEDRAPWEEHKVKTWPVDQHEFIIDGLEPMRTYYVRFAAENEVGLGYWAQERMETTPRRSVPEPPIILNEVQGFHGIAITAYPDRFELIWRVPQDNGERIQAFEITYEPVRNETYQRGTFMDYIWQQIGQRLEEEKPLGEPRHMLRNLAPETFYKVELRARNIIGSSEPSVLIFRTAGVPGDAYRPLRSSPVMSSSSSLHGHQCLLHRLFSSTSLVALTIALIFTTNVS